MGNPRQDLIDQINAEINTNGVGAITGEVMNEVLLKLLNIVPDKSFVFPRHSSIMAPNDIGKLVMNVDGEARVANTSGAKPGIEGVWTIEPLDKAIPYTPATTPQPRIIFAHYGNTGYSYGYYYGYGYGSDSPQEGDTFTLTLSNGTTITYVFTYTPGATAYDVSLNSMPMGGPYNNLIAKINSTPAVMMQGISAWNNAVFSRIEISDVIVTEGLNLNAAYTGTGFSGVTVFQYGSNGSSSGGYPYLYDDFFVFSEEYYESDVLKYVRCRLRYIDVFSLAAPSGTIYDGFRYPQNETQYADNIYWALTNAQAAIDLSLDPETAPLTDFLDITREGNLITLTQKWITEDAEMDVYFVELAPVRFLVVEEPRRNEAAYVQYPVLGVLLQIDGSAAYIDRGEVVKVILDKDVVFHELDNDIGTFPGNLTPRLLIPVDDGKVVPYFYNGRVNPQVVQSAQNPPEVALSRVNCFTYYEALEEGSEGDQILARRFTFLVSYTDDFQPYEYGPGPTAPTS